MASGGSQMPETYLAALVSGTSNGAVPEAVT
jgi:hypothetical protein